MSRLWKALMSVLLGFLLTMVALSFSLPAQDASGVIGCDIVMKASDRACPGTLFRVQTSKDDDDKLWSAFLAWANAAPEQVTLKAYAEKLGKDGLSQAEIQRQIEILRKVLTEHPEKGIELTYDRIFSKPITGDPAKDGFTSTPSAFMVEAVKGLKPGRALDVGTGQGRNAVWLAQQDWDVTGIDVSGAGLAAARANAEKVGRRIATVKTTYAAFDFGTEK